MIDPIDLVWNFPLLEGQQATWARYFAASVAASSNESVESLRPSFRTADALAVRERAARWLGFPVERTWLTCGGHHGTLNALLASGLAGTRVAVEGVSYPGFLDQCRMIKTSVVGCAFDDEGLVPNSLREVCARARAEGSPVRGLFTMPTVQNPLGFVTPESRRREIVAIARESDLVLIEDDAFGFLEESAPPSYARLAPERTFYVRGLAKSLAPSCRTGFLVTPGSAAEAVFQSLKCTATGTDAVQNRAALAMCEDGALDELMRAKCEEGAARNAAARALLGASAAPGARCAWHLWIPLPPSVSPDEVERACNETDVMVTNGKWSAAAPEFGHGIRVALGGEIERERTLVGVRRGAEVLRRFRVC